MDVPVDDPLFPEWEAQVKEDLYSWNIFAIADAALHSAQYNWTHTAFPTIADRNFTVENGSRVLGNNWYSRVNGNGKFDPNTIIVLLNSFFFP